MDYDSYKKLSSKAGWREQSAEFIAATLVLIFVIWSVYATIQKMREDDKADKLKFVTTITRDGQNPCRIIVVSKNHYEERSFGATMEGCIKP